MRFIASALLALALSAALVLASPKPPSSFPQNDVPQELSNIESDVYGKLNSRCAQRDSIACIKLKLLAYMDKLLKKSSIELTEDVVVTQTAQVSEVTEQFISSPRELAEEDDDFKLFSLVTGKARSFLQSRELHWKVMPETDVIVSTGRDSSDVDNLNVRFSVNTARAAETARHKIKGLFALAAAGVTKIGIIAALKFAALVALVFKAVVVSKLALALSLIVGLVKLLSHQQHAVTYEVVSHPHVSSSSIGGSGGGGSHSGSSSGLVGSSADSHHDSYSSNVGYGRSDVAATPVDNLAYSAHVPN